MARVPRVLFAVPGILAGILVPTVLVSKPTPHPPHTVGMTFMDFSDETVTVHVGQRLTLVNDSRNIHAIGPGRDGKVVSPVPGEPITGYTMLETNGVYVSKPWLKPGKYYVTCSIHPMMNLTVIVVSGT